VFVVDTPAQRQASDYNKRGYLDLEHLLVRLNPTNYGKFYGDGYGLSEDLIAPRLWQFPESSAWSNAPLAGFPSYTINVKKGGGFLKGTSLSRENEWGLASETIEVAEKFR